MVDEKETVTKWGITALCGYVPFTDIYEELEQAERFGTSGVVDKYASVFREFRSDYRKLTELAMALNWKSHEHQKNRPVLSSLYDTLFFSVDKYAQETFNGEALRYYLRTTD